MSTSRSKRATGLAVVAAGALMLTLAGPAAAAEPVFEMELPAGLACADFDLQIAGYGDGAQVGKEFTNPAGTVRALTAGTGFQLVFTNGSTGSTISTRSNGAVSWTTYNADGSQRFNLQGHNVVILFPADGGPSTTLYVGKVSIDQAVDGAWTVTKAAGTAMDICGALS